MGDILDKIPVDPVVVFGPDDEGKALMQKKVDLKQLAPHKMSKFLAATLKEDSSSEDTLPVKVVQVVDPLSTDIVFEGSNYVDDYVEIENILGEL